MYSRFRSAIKNVIVIIATSSDTFLCDVQVGFERDGCIMGVVFTGAASKSWGDIYSDAKKKTPTCIQQLEGVTSLLQRAFTQFIMDQRTVVA